MERGGWGGVGRGGGWGGVGRGGVGRGGGTLAKKHCRDAREANQGTIGAICDHL